MVKYNYGKSYKSWADRICDHSLLLVHIFHVLCIKKLEVCPVLYRVTGSWNLRNRPHIRNDRDTTYFPPSLSCGTTARFRYWSIYWL